MWYQQSKHVAVVDLGYGDSGKGILVARLCKEFGYRMVVKASGGSQCAHNVVLEDGRHHTFSQFGSGTFEGATTFLGPGYKVEPFEIMKEAKELAALGVEDPLSHMFVAWNALMTTPYHAAVNRWQEDQRGNGRHGSCGRGIGMTAFYALEHPEDAPVVGDISSPYDLLPKLMKLQRWALDMGVPSELLPSYVDLIERYSQLSALNIGSTNDFSRALASGNVVFEGSQGVLLDEHYGFHPNTTWSETTDRPARDLAESHRSMSNPFKLTTIGVLRAYTTRHGHGPFVTESEDVTIDEPYNGTSHWQGSWRRGHLDLAALRYAISVCDSVDGLYVTHTDSVLEQPVKWCGGYEVDGQPFEIKALPRDAFDERQKQTESLYKATPVLRDAPSQNVLQLSSQSLDGGLHGTLAEYIARNLGKVLFGYSTGPKVEDGEFLKEEWWAKPRG